MILNFALIAWFSRKWKKAWSFVEFLGHFELEMPSFYRQEVWNVRQGRTWHFAIWSCLKGQERQFTKKGNFLFYHVLNFYTFDPILSIIPLTDIYQFIYPLGKVRKLLDEETQKWPIIWSCELWKLSFMEPFVSISKT